MLNFERLLVWQKSIEYAEILVRIADDLPQRYQFSFGDQLRRAALSIPSNIAEGYGRQFNKEYRQFLSVAYGSLCELRTQIRLSVDLGYIKEPSLVLSLAEEVSKMLYRMIYPVR